MTSSLQRRAVAVCLAVIALGLMFASTGEAQAATSTPWIVIRCQFADEPGTPGATPQLDRLFTTAGSGGMVDYWRDMSGGAVDLSGSTVAPGWFRMSLTLSAARKMTWPAARFDLEKACIDAADPSVDFRPYYGIVVATNELIDAGSTKRQSLWLDGTQKTYGLVNLDSGAWFPTFAAHEMGHGFGLDHSFAGTEYGDGWDIMSAFTFGGRRPTFSDPVLGESGPALSGAYRDLLGWIPGSDRVDANSLGGGTTVTLSALDGGPAGHPRIARVYLGFSTHYYVVEFRQARGWDRAIGRDTVLVHYMDQNVSYIQASTAGNFDFQAGQVFIDPNENLSISVLGIDSAQGTATVHIGPLPPGQLHTSATTTPSANAAGWNDGPVDVDLSATAAPGTWVDRITTSATGAGARPTTVHLGAAARVHVAAEGMTTLVYAARDNTGAGELPRKLQVKIDTQAPVTTASTMRFGGVNTITLNAADEPGGSGLKQLQYMAVGADPIPLTTTTQPTARIRIGAPGATTLFYWAVDNAGNYEGPHSLWLRPIPTVSPGALDFFAAPNAVSPPQTVTLRNQGTTTLTIKGVTTTDPAFTVVPNPTLPCGPTLAPGTSCRIDVVFNPFTLTSYQGALNIATDAPGSALSVPLTGVGEPAKLDFAPVSLAFPGTLLRATSAAQTATIRNSGRVPLVISGVTPGTGGDFMLTGDRCGPYPATLAPGAACQVDVAFSPLYDGPRSGGLAVTSNVPGPAQVLPLSGQGIAQPELTAAPSALDFGDQALATSGAPARIEVTNPGTAPLHIGAVALTGADPADFRIVRGGSCLPSRLNPTVVVAVGRSCELRVVFRPTALGARSAAVELTSDAPGPPASVALTGTGVVAPDIAFDPSPAAFADQAVGTTSSPFTLRVTNTSAAPVQLDRVEAGGKEFSVVQDGCAGQALRPGDACLLLVEFTPGDIGLRTAALTVTDDAGTAYATTLQGTGTGGRLGFDSPSVDFGAWPLGASDRRDVTIRNTGNAPVTIAHAAPTTPDFAANAWCDGARIVPGGYCTVRVAFLPKAAGPRQDELVVTSDAPGPAARLPLSGTGTVADIGIDAAALDFGDQAVSTTSASKTATVLSSGTAPLSLDAVTLAGANASDFALTQNCSFRGLMPGEKCTIAATFTPTASGARTATVTIDSNAPGSPHHVTLSGSGT